MMLEQVRRRADEFDVLHFHIDFLHFPLLRDIADAPAVTTLHGRLDLPDLMPFYRAFPDMPAGLDLRTTSARRCRRCNWVGTVHHGLPRGPATASARRRRRLPRLPRPHLAREAPRPGDRDRHARRACRCKIAAKVDDVDQDYWQAEIEPLLRDDPLVEFVGEIGEREKAALPRRRARRCCSRSTGPSRSASS